MNRPVRILYVDDYPLDRELVRDALEKEHGGFELVEAASRAEFETSFAQGGFDLILSDFNILGFEGLQVLEAVHAKGSPLPVIIVTGTGSEEIAAEAIKRGAADYVIKSPKHIQHLPHTIRAVLDKKRLENERVQAEAALQLSEEKYRTLVNEVQDGFYVTDSAGVFTFVNPALARMYGYERPEALVGRTSFDFVAPGMQAELGAAYRTAMQVGHAPETINGQIMRPDGTHALIEIKSVLMVKDGQMAGSRGVVRDITERKQREVELQAIATVSAALRTASTRAEMLPIILDQLLELLHADGAALAMCDPASGDSVVEGARGEFAVGLRARVAPGEGVSGLVIASRKPFVTSDIRSEAGIARPDAFQTIRAAACVPLMVQEQVLGTLWVGRQSEISPAEVRLLMSIADIAANAIHRETLHEQTEERLKRLVALRTIDMAINSSLDLHFTLNVLLEQVSTQLGMDAVAVLLFNRHFRALEYSAGRGFRGKGVEASRVRLGDGHAGLAALERRTIQIPNLALEEVDLTRAPLLEQEGFQAYYCAPLIAKGEIKGVLEAFHRTPIRPDREWLEFLEALAGQAAIAIDSAQLFDQLQRSNLHLSLAYDATIEGWSRALDLRDKETEGHTLRVTEMTLRLARVIGSFSEVELVQVHRGALLHDIGKMGIPDAILLKPGPLTEEEWVTMRQHPMYAYKLLSPILYLRPALDIPYCHHERWDGTGYPRGLKGEQIPLAARVFAVADVWDALRSDRPYRVGWPAEKVRVHIQAGQGLHFDPQIADVFLKMISED